MGADGKTKLKQTGEGMEEKLDRGSQEEMKLQFDGHFRSCSDEDVVLLKFHDCVKQ